jgi:hypothetical protein
MTPVHWVNTYDHESKEHISYAYVSDMVNGRRDFSEKVLDILGRSEEHTSELQSPDV